MKQSYQLFRMALVHEAFHVWSDVRRQLIRIGQNDHREIRVIQQNLLRDFDCGYLPPR